MVISLVIISCQQSSVKNLYPIVNEYNKWGAIDEFGNIIIEPKFDNLTIENTFLEDGRLSFFQASEQYINFGFDKIGKIKIDSTFALENVRNLRINRSEYRGVDSLKLIIENGRYFFTSKDRNEFGDFIFAKQFSGNYALVKHGDHFRYIDSKGKINKKRYKWASSFFKDLAIVKTGEEIKYINKDFKDVYVFVRYSEQYSNLIKDYPKNYKSNLDSEKYCKSNAFQRLRNYDKFTNRIIVLFDLYNNDL